MEKHSLQSPALECRHLGFVTKASHAGGADGGAAEQRVGALSGTASALLPVNAAPELGESENGTTAGSEFHCKNENKCIKKKILSFFFIIIIFFPVSSYSCTWAQQLARPEAFPQH